MADQYRSALDRIRQRIADGTQAADTKQPARYRSDPPCDVCGGAGWLAPDLDLLHPDFGTGRGEDSLIPCRCRRDRMRQKARQEKRQYLLSIDGLTPEERTITFDNLHIDDSRPDLQLAHQALRQMVDDQAGICMLHGHDTGVTKTALAIAAINYCRDEGHDSISIPMWDLLNELRRGFDPEKGEPDYDERWELLRNVQVLHIDEVDKFNTTPWAKEHWDALLNDRWRFILTNLTILTCNRLSNLERHIRSRLGDGRARLFELTGPDHRPLLR